MRKDVLIVGDGAIKANLTRQCEQLGWNVTLDCELTETAWDFDEIIMLGDDDDRAMKQLSAMAKNPPADKRRPIVHWLLHSPATLWLLQTTGLPDRMGDCMDVYPFTMEDVWAKNIIVHMPGQTGNNYPALDRTPIGADSQQTVHLVICGFDAQAEAVAIHTALTAHYPNYSSRHDKPLRTRITIVDSNLSERRDRFIARHQHLFDNSYYRCVDIDKRTTSLHKPMYHGRRMDFVDVEWEFVDGAIGDTVVREHLTRWAVDDRQQLSIVVSHDSDEQNMAESTSLPQVIYDRGITVFVRQRTNLMAHTISSSGRYAAVYPFGMSDHGYDVTLPLWRLAKLLNYFYTRSYGSKDVPTDMPADEVDAAWADVRSLKMRISSQCNVMTIATKMHSMGHDPKDADTFYALTQSEIEVLSATEHNRWSVERLIMGTRPCTDAERDEICQDITRKQWYKKTKDVHFDLCAYEELQADETGRNVQIYDYDLIACIPLMAKTFFDSSTQH